MITKWTHQWNGTYLQPRYLMATILFGMGLWLSSEGFAEDGGRPDSGSKKEKAVQKGRRILALGDSYTIGQSVKVSERWPVQLTKLIKRKGFSIGDPEIIARTGWTTDELSKGIEKKKPKGPYPLVTLSIGVNNQFRKRGAEEFRKQFAALLKRALTLAGENKERVLVISIPDYGVTPFGQTRGADVIAKSIDRFNTVKKEVAGKAGVAFIDVTGISRKAATEGNLIAEDGLHPSGKMYEQWAQLILPHALKALKRE